MNFHKKKDSNDGNSYDVITITTVRVVLDK